MSKIIHFCAGLEDWNGMANTARQFVAEELARGDVSRLTNDPSDIDSDANVVVIHGAWLPVLWKVAKIAKRNGARLYIRPAGSYDPVRLGYHAWRKRFVSWFEHKMLARADVILATCEAEVVWIKDYATKVNQIEITDLKRFFNLPTSSFQNKASKPKLNILYLGRMHPLKGTEFLIDAVKDMPQIELRLVSNAFDEEKEAVWHWADVLVLPTRSENFGRVVAEALERGKRVVTTDGAPAWGDGNTYGGRLTYLVGYRDGSPTERVAMLQDAIAQIAK